MVRYRVSARVTDFNGLSPRPMVVVSGQDITDEVRAHRKIVEGHRLLDIVTRSVDVGLAIVDQDMVFRFANRRFANAMGSEPRHLIKKTICGIGSANAQTLLEAARIGLNRPHVVPEVEWIESASPGGLWYRIAINPHADETDGGNLAVIVLEDITSRKIDEMEIRRSEMAARESETRLRALMEALPTPVVIADRDGAFTLVNAAYRRVCRPIGVPSSTSDYAMFHGRYPDGRMLSLDDWPMTRALKKGEVVVAERIDMQRSDDGTYRRFAISAAPVHDNKGNITGAIAAAEDLTELLDAEEAAGETEALLRMLVDSTRDHAVYMLNEEGSIVIWGGGARRLKQYDSAEVLGRNWSMFFGLADVADKLPERLLERARAEGVAYHRGWRYRKDGSRFWADTVLNTIENGGTIVGFAEVARDLTDERYAEAEIRLRNSALRAVSQGILVTDARNDNRIILASGGFTQLTGYECDAVIGQNCRFLQGPETDPAGLDAIRKAVAAGRECSVELINYREDGSKFWNALYLSPIFDEAGDLDKYIGVMADVTPRRDMETQLREGQKMDALGRLAGGIAHDFNNILTVINGNAEDLLYYAEKGDPTRDQLELILGAGERAEALTRQLLTFSRRDVSPASTVDVPATLNGMKALLRSLVGDSVTLTVDVSDDLWPALGEPGKVEQVIMNLVINARDALEDDRRIEVRARNVRLPKDKARNQAAGDYVQITVSDSGCGMSPDVVGRAFEPFFTTKGVLGSGLGLATVFGIVTQSGGRVSLESVPGVGTSVTVAFPRGEQQRRNVPADRANIATLPSARILLVEDEDEVRRYVRRVLERLGHDVIEARSGAEALEIERSTEGSIDILLSDIVMPGISGVVVADAFRKARPQTRIVLMSGYTEDALDPDNHDAFLQKPPTVEKMILALQGD
ncbi:PAS domain S-box protein [Sphingomonas floccifaciens]|uniref:histidine kinase n=2 Tax=Sphingomonas floccifaciens TaxID=1844115 RepID=A0ABW4NA34_9SPHN